MMELRALSGLSATSSGRWLAAAPRTLVPRTDNSSPLPFGSTQPGQRLSQPRLLPIAAAGSYKENDSPVPIQKPKTSLGPPASPEPAPLLCPSLECSYGVAALVLLNAALFFSAAYFRHPSVISLAISSTQPRWWQFVSSAFVHANLLQLARNTFLVYLYGNSLRRELTGVGVWFAYIACGLGANLALWFMLPARLSSVALLGAGANGGVVGLYLTALAMSFKPSSLKWLFGAIFSAQFMVVLLSLGPAGYVSGGSGTISNGLGASAAKLLTVRPAGGWDVCLPVLWRSPQYVWLWGVAAMVALVVVLAKMPE